MVAKRSGQFKVSELMVILPFWHEIYFVLDQKTSTSSSQRCKKSIRADNDNRIFLLIHVQEKEKKNTLLPPCLSVKLLFDETVKSAS